jgi:regulator of replication initiation timing
MDEEKTTEMLDKYVKLKDEYEALKVQLGALNSTNTELAMAYENAKGEIGNLQKIITKHVVSTEPDKTIESKPKTLREIFLNEYSKIEEEK